MNLLQAMKFSYEFGFCIKPKNWNNRYIRWNKNFGWCEYYFYDNKIPARKRVRLDLPEFLYLDEWEVASKIDVFHDGVNEIYYR